jgi:hypothetical protein
MESMTVITLKLSNVLFNGYTPKQKRDNVRFLHGMTLFLLTMLFIFAPSRSFARYLVLGLYIAFAMLYVVYGSCWVSDVESRLHNTTPGAVLDPVLSLLGIAKTKETRQVVVGVGYIFSILLMSCLIIRDMFGVY